MGYAVEIPEEPADRSVALDRDANAWQRRGSRWYGVKLGMFMSPPEALSTSWEYLLIDHGPLTPLITVDDCDAQGWQAAGFTGPDLDRYVQPEGVERVDAPGLDQPAGPDYANRTRATVRDIAGALTDDQRDDTLAATGQAVDYRDHDRRIGELKTAAGACASTWKITDDPDGGVTSSVSRAYPAGDEDNAG